MAPTFSREFDLNASLWQTASSRAYSIPKTATSSDRKPKGACSVTSRTNVLSIQAPITDGWMYDLRQTAGVRGKLSRASAAIGPAR